MKGLFIGRSTMDLSYLIEKYPEENEKIFAKRSLLQPGGQAQNAAITFSLLGGESVLISSFGNSSLAKFDKELINNNYSIEIIDIAQRKDYDFPVSSVFVNTSDASRTIVNSAKANDIIPVNLSNKIFNDIDLILIDGFNLSEPIIDLIDRHKKLGVKVIMDAGSWKGGMDEYLEKIDIIICSNRFRYPDKNKKETIEYLRSKGIKTIAFSNEENPLELYEHNKEIISFEVPKIEAIDTLGAGDVLHGSFCYHFAKTNDLHKSIELSILDATESCKYFGTHTWIAKCRYEK